MWWETVEPDQAGQPSEKCILRILLEYQVQKKDKLENNWDKAGTWPWEGRIADFGGASQMTVT